MTSIRKLHPIDDFQKTKRLFKETFSLPPWEDDWKDDHQLDLYIHELLDPTNALCLGCFEGEELLSLALGRVMHFYLGTQFRIDEFCVRKDRQGKGFGSFFFDQIKDYCKENKIRYLLLDTTKTFPAYSFYRKNGFQDVKDNVSLACDLQREKIKAPLREES